MYQGVFKPSFPNFFFWFLQSTLEPCLPLQAHLIPGAALHRYEPSVGQPACHGCLTAPESLRTHPLPRALPRGLEHLLTLSAVHAVLHTATAIFFPSSLGWHFRLQAWVLPSFTVIGPVTEESGWHTHRPSLQASVFPVELTAASPGS